MKNALLTFRTIVLLLVLAPAVSTAQLNINHYMRVGQTRISIGNYVGAIEYFNIVIKFKPYMPEPYFFRGVAKLQLEDFYGAINDFEKAIEIKPFYPDAYTQRGAAYHELKDYDRAIADYNKALELDPKNEGVYNNRGIAKIARKDIDGAIEDYNKALEINPSSTHALMNRSNAKIIRGDIRGAIQDLNSVIIIRPHYAGAYLNRGLARFELNDYASALRDYDQCIRLDPQNALAYNNRGIVKHKLEDYAGAIMDYDMAINLDRAMANAYFNRAMAREILKRPGFENDYQIAADLNPQYDLSRFTLSAEQLAQQSGSGQSGQSQPSGQSSAASGKSPGQAAQQSQAGQQQTAQQSQAGQQQTAQQSQGAQQQTGQQTTQPNQTAKSEEASREEELRRRRRLNLIVSDSRNPTPDDNQDDPYVQNRNITIDLQPVFLITALEKNSVNYERLQYYNLQVEELNRLNNYYPLLTITNRNEGENLQSIRNFILYFNDKINVASNAQNYLNRGILNCITGNYNQSLDDINRVLTLDSTSALAWLTRGNCRFKMTEHIRQVTEAPDQLVIARENSRQVRNVQVETVMTNTDYDLIYADYDKVLKLQPGFIFGWFNRAHILLVQKRYREAMADLDKAIELEPEFAEAYYNRGLTKIFLDDPKGGALDLSKAGELGLVEAYSVIKRYCN